MSVGKKAGKGFVSIFYRNMLEKLVGMAAMVILARKLTPYDFGLVSITEALLYLISSFGTTGLAEYLLAYRKDDSDEIFKSAFWFNICITAGICLLFIIAVPFWTDFQSDDRIWKIGLLLMAGFIFSQLQLIPKTLLSRNLMFDRQVKIQAPFIVLIAAGKIVAVYLNFGVYSLIIPTLLFQPATTFLLYRASGFVPTLRLYINRWKEIYRFTRYLIGSGILSRLADQGDKIILGKMLGLEVLGIYNIALQLADLVSSQLVTVSNNILSSVLPKYVHDKNKFYNYYITFLKTFAFAMLPILSIMLVNAKPIILVLYGQQWIDAALPMQILIVYAVFRTLTSSYGSVMNSFHLNKISFKTTLAYTPFHITGSFIGAMFGIAGLATSVTLVKLLFTNIGIRQTMHAVSLPMGRWYKDLYPYLSGFVITLVLAFIIQQLKWGLDVIPLVAIAINALLFLTGYYLFYKLFFRRELETISVFLNSVFPRSQKMFNFLFGI